MQQKKERKKMVPIKNDTKKVQLYTNQVEIVHQCMRAFATLAKTFNWKTFSKNLFECLNRKFGPQNGIHHELNMLYWIFPF